MNIMVLVVSYPPVISSTARLYSELVEDLCGMGHSLTVITSRSDDDNMAVAERLSPAGASSGRRSGEVHVCRVASLSFLSKIPGGKPLRFFVSCCLYILQGLFSRRPDVILVYSPPLYMGISGYVISRLRRARFVFNLQDIHPKVLFHSGAIKNPILKGILSWMEKFCYKKSHSLIVYSEGNRAHIVKTHPQGEVHIIPNWADIDRAQPPIDGNPLFRNEETIGNKFVVSYAGTMHHAQGLEVVVEAAEILGEDSKIVFLLAGEGPLRSVLVKMIADKNIRNVFMRPVMPKDRYKQFLHESDVCLISLSADIPAETVPGKLPDIMAHGKPVILAADPRGDAAQIITDAQCGFCVKPGDAKTFARAVLDLHGSESLRKQMGENGRVYAQRHFSRAACTKQYEAVLIPAMRGVRHDSVKAR